MVETRESVTAKLCSFARAFHSNIGKNKIFDDYLAYDLMGRDEYEEIGQLIQNDFDAEKSDKNFVFASDKITKCLNRYITPIPLSRIAFAESELNAFARRHGKCQYVICGAGIVYIPYGIALLPTFRSVSVFVIFLATFWPVLAGTMSGVMNVDKKTIDSAKVLNVGKITMLFSVILPAFLQQIFIGCNQGLTVSFVLLTSAEMIGAQSGLGYYIKNYSDFGDYTRTLVGLIVIGIVIVVISFGFNKIQKYLLRWKH